MNPTTIIMILGEGVPAGQVDVLKAAEYFEKARLKGIIQAGINLVSLYRGNHGHPIDLPQALELIKSFYSTNEEFKTILKDIELEMKKGKS